MALVNDEPNRLAIDALHLGPGERVLELGFGPGWSLRTIAARTRGARVYGVDQSARMLEQATRMNEVAVSSGRMLLVQGPFSPLPWIDEMFDKVLLINVVYFFLFRWLLYVRFLLFVAFVCMCFYVFRVFSSFWFFLLLALSVSSDRGRCV
jgi:SAM-dependent methyltransferase